MKVDFKALVEVLKRHEAFFFTVPLSNIGKAIEIERGEVVKYFSLKGGTFEVLSKALASGSVELPISLVKKILKVRGLEGEVGLEDRGKSVKISTKEFTVLVGKAVGSDSSHVFPDITKLDFVKVEEGFSDALKAAKSFSSSDDRRVSLYGVWWSRSGHVFSSDNYRVFRTKKAFENRFSTSVFFPSDFLDRMAGLSLSALAVGENLVAVSCEPSFIAFFSGFGAVQEPSFSRAFEGREWREEWVELDKVSGSEVLDNASLFLFGEDGRWFVIDVSIEPGSSHMSIYGSSFSKDQEARFSIPLKNEVRNRVEFCVDSEFFVDACLKFDRFRCSVDGAFLWFENDKYVLLVAGIRK